MRMTVLGGGGAWPTPERGCSGYLIDEAGFLVLVDPGHATVPQPLQDVAAGDVDAVLALDGQMLTADYALHEFGAGLV